ncbi:amylo-alpha-1,6-glucosidase-domain-containing protein, partial [Chytriomyces sp. MP71]
PITHDGYLLIARCAFNKYHGSDTHSPIVLRNQMVHIMESAGLRVQAPISDSMPGSQDELPSGPYGPHDTNAIQHAKDDRAHVRGRKTLGVISGLPCFLDFSPVLSTLVNVQEQDLNDGKSEFANMQTTITVNQDKFLPGSIVLFRTWMKGSGMDLVVPDPTMSPVPSPMRIAANLTLANTAGVDYNGVNPSTSPLLIKKLLMPKPKAAAAASILVSNYDQGYLEILWQLMGVENRNRGAEIMIQMGRDELDAGNLAFTSDLGVWPPGLWDAVSVLEDEDINIVLYRCAGEEWDSIGDGAYNIPGHGDLPYCGLQGFMSVIEQVARNNDLGHAICANLRAGPWMMDYVVGRLNKYSAKFPNMSKLAAWFEERFRIIKTLSPSFVPKYFFQLIFLAYCAVHFKAIAVLCSLHQQKFICPDSSTRRVSSLEVLAQQLALTTYQLYGRVNTTSLFPLAKYPETPFNDPHGVACLAAGLPHFSSRHMRCWGRDIFISLRGLFLIPGHFDAARSHLIAFASTLRHGLIPNLLDQGNFSRYNARDASWWWLYAVQQYCQSSPEGLTFLGTTVYRRFPPLRRYRQGPDYLKEDESSEIPGDEGDMYISTDDPKMYQHVSTIGQICHEILERHARGISFKEWNAGPNLDHAMQDAGFHVSCHTKFDNGSGLLFGGNRFNCGTWMDKMGDSEKAGTKGLPATPRDGAAVEIIGLLKATLRWITKEVLSSEHRNLIPATGVS